jgi:hypothetical protein
MSLADDVTNLQERIAEAQRQRARAEGTRDAAANALDNAMAELRDQFGVTTVEDAEVLQGRLRLELEHLIHQINTKLDQIGV